MTIKFNKYFFASSLMLLSTEICIASFLTEGFIRYTFGDFLVVILIYCTLRSIIVMRPIYLGSGVLLFAFMIEFLQKINLLYHLDLRDNQLAIIVLGSTFEITDLLAYTLGVITVVLIDIETSST